MSVETKERPAEESEHQDKKGLWASLKGMIHPRETSETPTPGHPGYGNVPPEIVETRQRNAEAMAARDAQMRQNVEKMGEDHAATGETPRVQSSERDKV